MFLQGGDLLGLERVPHEAVVVLVACEQEAAALGERDGSDAAYDRFIAVGVNLSAGTSIEETAALIV